MQPQQKWQIQVSAENVVTFNITLPLDIQRGTQSNTHSGLKKYTLTWPSRLTGRSISRSPTPFPDLPTNRKWSRSTFFAISVCWRIICPFLDWKRCFRWEYAHKLYRPIRISWCWIPRFHVYVPPCYWRNKAIHHHPEIPLTPPPSNTPTPLPQRSVLWGTVP